ncbi:molecular chaperone [Morganella morganii]|uniref:fimbrial biogenesis chaperone n=1 Tax=Morganella morganii TaxID=582 RepID=UPI0034E3C7F2
MIKKLLKKSVRILVLSALFIQCATASEGFNFPLKRYVYQESSKNGISITLSNNTAIPYLIETWVSGTEENAFLPAENIKEDKAPFIILPPLKKLESHHSYSWVIRRTGNEVNGKTLPQDRESLFWIGMKAIPAENKSDSDGISFKISPEFYFKLLYRPSAIENITLADIEDKLVVKQNKNMLTLENPTPLFVTFDKLMAGNTELKDGNALITVEPFSSKDIVLPAGNENDVITWQINDENLFELEKHTVTNK